MVRPYGLLCARLNALKTLVFFTCNRQKLTFFGGGCQAISRRPAPGTGCALTARRSGVLTTGRLVRARYDSARIGRALTEETAMDRAQKAETVESLKGVFAGAGMMVIGHYSGLTVADMTVLRTRLRAAGGSLKVVKNRLVKLAIDGTPKASAGGLFTGPTAIAYSSDPIAAAKVAVAYAKEKEKFVILGGLFGDQLLDTQGVQAIATLPSLDELRGKIIGLVQAPATKIAGVLAAPGGQLARVLNAYATKDAA
jgi:large subunit ribosomal protein L10